MKHFKTLTEMNRWNGFPPPENPLLSLYRCNKTCTIGDREFTSDFYMIGFKKLISGTFLYGRTKYDHDSGYMSFVKPRQIIEMKNLEFEEDGFLIFFHEDFLNGHPLHTEIKKYGYFEYETNEALNLSPSEEKTIKELQDKIETEYYNNQDEYSRDIILGHIDSILKYSQRFYKRQFMNRTVASGKMASKFNDALSAYFEKGKLLEQGLPTVNFMAEELNLSPRYLSDLLKQETGKTAMELIHIFLISEAKNILKGSDNNIAETAYSLGFDNLPYFSRLFKKEVGVSPLQFRKQILN
ncbi:helix-turn-helix domain-containing protein [Mucilaginibacter jinjuensis]|uniref:AraC family transcriptional regulator n=1 Tax=Mucilaginibacter jinjuensis TaxID=1176721 RepID=A0ABY7T5Y0_9SPHI|nr:AraC family transcriptional regulator [Mucilaginibacter jinjuensis]WCT11776.1 AraC family transcriptional regulator [Mucilaginibacter jinjuensis]